MSYKNNWLSACFGNDNGSKIDVKFKNHNEPDVFSKSMLSMLVTDPAVEWITDAESGEILYFNN